jgi:hypothetical protein
MQEHNLETTRHPYYFYVRVYTEGNYNFRLVHVVVAYATLSIFMRGDLEPVAIYS